MLELWWLTTSSLRNVKNKRWKATCWEKNWKQACSPCLWERIISSLENLLNWYCAGFSSPAQSLECSLGRCQLPLLPCKISSEREEENRNHKVIRIRVLDLPVTEQDYFSGFIVVWILALFMRSNVTWIKEIAHYYNKCWLWFPISQPLNSVNTCSKAWWVP